MKKIKHLLFFITLLFLSFSCSNIEETSQLKNPETIGSATNYTNPNSDYDYITTSKIGERYRTYNVHLPKNFDNSGKLKYSVIILLHGFTSTGEAIGDRMKEHAFNNNIVLVCPNGYKNSWNAGTCCGSAKKEGIDDLTFISKVVSNFYSANYVNTKQIDLVGFSNGGMMAYRFLCQSSEASKISGLGVVSGSMVIQESDCTNTYKIPIIHIHSDKDSVVPYKGRIKAPKVPSVYPMLEFFAKRYDKYYESNTLELDFYTFYSFFNESSNFIYHYKLNYTSSKVIDRPSGYLGHFWPTSDGTDGKVDATKAITDFFRVN